MEPRGEPLRAAPARVPLLLPADPAAIEHLPLFAALDQAHRARVLLKAARYLHVFPVAAGETILRQGQYSDSIFYVIEGTVEAVIQKASDFAGKAQVRGGAVPPAERPVPALGRGVPAPVEALRIAMGADSIFGELGALSRFPVTATVRAATPTTLLRVRLPGLRLLMSASPAFRARIESLYRDRALARQLRGVRLFSGLDDAEIERLKQTARLQSYEPGQVIFAEGAPLESFVLVGGGYVKVSVELGHSDLAVTYLREGDYAGEAVLMGESRWPFTLQALEHVELVSFSPDVLREVVARHPGMSAELEGQAEARLRQRETVAWNPAAAEHLQMAMETGLVHGESVLLLDLAACTRCDDCVRGCAETHGGIPRFVREGQKYQSWQVPAACYQCSDPVCMLDCPTGAITREVGTLVVSIDEPTCIGCSNCAQRCPWGNIVMVPRDTAAGEGTAAEVGSKCDLCPGRAGGPACVEACPHGAAVRISFKEIDRLPALLDRGPRPPLAEVMRPRDPRAARAALAAAALLSIVYMTATRGAPLVPRHGLGLGFGVLAALAYATAMLYGARRSRLMPVRGARGWLQAHVYVGALGALAVLMHMGFTRPAGAMGTALVSLSLWTAATGVVGVVLQKWIAAALASGLSVEAVYERIPSTVDQLRADADALVRDAGPVLERFYRAEVHPAMLRVRPSLSFLLDVRSGREAALVPLRRMLQFVEAEDKPRVEELITLLIEKMELDAQYSLQRVLRLWPLLHVPAACVLTGLVALHVLAWAWY